MNLPKSAKLFEAAQAVMPGGVSSPVRAFRAVDGVPPFIKKASGPHIWDVDGNRYIDYVGSWGPAIVGHANEEVVQAVTEAASSGLSFGAPTETETLLAEKIVEAVPAADMVRFVSSGTEACFSAIRLARGFTGRDLIIKFTGNYHGHGDSLLVKAGSGVATLGLPDSPGVLASTAESTLVARYNNLAEVEELFDKYPDRIAAVIVEPIAGNAGFIRPKDGFLQGLRKLTEENGTLLIMDEVMTGFRVAWGGAQNLFDIKPDLSTFGKVIGGGMPLAAYCGRREIMEKVAPAGPIYQAGTLSGNPLATACGLKTLEILERPGAYKTLHKSTEKLANGLSRLADDFRIPFISDFETGMYGYFFSGQAISSFEETAGIDMPRFKKFHAGMLGRGVYLAPSAYEAGFVSLAHGDVEIESTLNAAAAVFEGTG